MKYILGLAAVGCSTVVEAGSFKWNANDIERGWAPAYPTVGVMPILGAAAPATTSPPNLAEARDLKRSTENNTCAYLSGDADIPLYCQTDSVCAYNPILSNIGCCPDTSTKCVPWTTCYDMTDATLFTTDNGYTMLCADADYPRCKRHIYQDDSYTGYTMWGCAIAGGTDKVWYSATYTPSSTGGSSASDLDISLDGASTTISGAPTSSAASATSDGSPDTSAMTTKSKDSSTPIGAIVGGVVGGVAVVALFVLGLVFLLRRRRRGAGPNDNPNPQQTPTDLAGGYPPRSPSPQPAMQQQYEQPNFQPPVDPATGYTAVAPVKPGYNYNATHSMYGSSVGTPPGSPPFQGPGPVTMVSGYPVSNASTYALNPQGDPTYGALQSQGTSAGATQAHTGNIYHEMPTEPSGRELRELP